MCTETRRRCTVGALLLLATALLPAMGAAQPASTAAADARDLLATWLTGEDPILLVIVADGLRPDRCDADGPWLDPVMPIAKTMRAQTIHFDDVLSGQTSPGPAVASLARGLEPLRAAGFTTHTLIAPTDLRSDQHVLADAAWLLAGTVLEGEAGEGRCVEGKDPRWLAEEERALDALLDEAGAAAGPQLIVAVVDHLLPPYPIPRDLLLALDPEPWAGAAETPTRIEEHVQRRLQRVGKVAAASEAPHVAGREKAMREYRWVVDAAHARFDRFLGRLLTKLDEPNLRHRAGFLLTATSATATGERGLAGSGVGARLGVAHVPLILRPPARFALAHGDSAPRQLEDLAPTWRELLGEPSASSLFAAVDRGRARGTVGCARGASATGPKDVVEARWVRSDLSLVDSVLPVRARRLHDRVLDPAERVDRAHLFPNVADSLVTVARAELYGPRPRVHLRATGVAGARLRLATRGSVTLIGDVPEGAQRRGNDVLWNIAGEAAELAVALDDGPVDLRLRWEEGPAPGLLVGGIEQSALPKVIEIPLHGLLFVQALRGPSNAATTAPRLELWIESEGLVRRWLAAR